MLGPGMQSCFDPESDPGYAHSLAKRERPPEGLREMTEATVREWRLHREEDVAAESYRPQASLELPTPGGGSHWPAQCLVHSTCLVRK